ncbi:MAG: glutathione S-transferase C-terminal domain-containing protein, partial [Myxococcota bacterium]
VLDGLAAGDPAIKKVYDSYQAFRKTTTRLVPADPHQAALAWSWEEFADTTLSGFVVAARWADERNWPSVRKAFFGHAPPPIRWIVPTLLRRSILKGLDQRDVWHLGPDHCWNRFQTVLDHLEQLSPTRGFWMESPSPTVADVAMFAQLQSLRLPLTPWQAQQIDARPTLAAWLDRVHDASHPSSPPASTLSPNALTPDSTSHQQLPASMEQHHPMGSNAPDVPEAHDMVHQGSSTHPAVQLEGLASTPLGLSPLDHHVSSEREPVRRRELRQGSPV